MVLSDIDDLNMTDVIAEEEQRLQKDILKEEQRLGRVVRITNFADKQVQGIIPQDSLKLSFIYHFQPQDDDLDEPDLWQLVVLVLPAEPVNTDDPLVRINSSDDPDAARDLRVFLPFKKIEVWEQKKPPKSAMKTSGKRPKSAMKTSGKRPKKQPPADEGGGGGGNN